MDLAKMRELSLDEIRTAYKEYLKKQDLSINTINTSSVDAFYLWRKGSRELFWDTIFSDNFENVAKSELLDALKANSKGDVNSLTNGYMGHLRRFKRFLSTDSKFEPVTSPMLRTKSRDRVKSMKNVPMPEDSVVEEYLDKWETLENYQLQESALNKLFFDLCPENNKIEDVLLKASTLNDFYSTNIFSIYPVAKHIVSLGIDSRLKYGDVTLVGDIQEVVIGGVKKNFYSFATKYCSHHNPLDYPIYDSYVDEVLRHFRKQDRFFDFADIDLKNYEKFKTILVEFRKFYKLEKYNLKQIDQYMWQLGKDYFPKNYKKKK